MAAADHNRKVTVYSLLGWEPLPAGAVVERVRPVIRWPRLLSEIETAFRLWLRSAPASSVGLVEAERQTLLFCLLRSLLPTKGKVVVYNLFLQPGGRLKMALIRRAIGAATMCVVTADSLGDRYSTALGLPRQHFVTVRWQSTYSRFPHIEKLPLGDFIFSGGDSERDYPTLFEAVRNLDIPVVVSRTDAALTHGCRVPENVPDNVLLIRAIEPHFARLVASARLVVVPLTAGRLRGAGETVCLNAMWHGRPVICADDLAAVEYVENGVDGIVVPPGDPARLREAILMLWHDRKKAEAMGQAGMQKARTEHSYERFVARMLALARTDGSRISG